MKRIARLFALTISTAALLFSSLSYAQSDEQHIQEILDRTGFNKLLDYVPQLSQNILKQSAGTLDPEVTSALNGAFQRAFTSRAVRRSVLATVRGHFDADKAEQYLTQLNSPLAQQMAALERLPNQAENQAAFQTYASQLQSSPAAAPRQALIERLDTANNTTGFSVELQTALFKAVFAAVDPILDDDMKLSEGELDKMVTEVRESLHKDTQFRTHASYLFAFKDLTDAELNSYVELCESSQHRWAIQLLGNAMVSALNQSGERAALFMAQSAE